MTGRTFHRIAAAVIQVAAALAAINTASAAPDEATKARCATYAQRAVQQYQLLMSHPQCQSNIDSLSWKDNYDYHFNGCLLFPAKMSVAAEQARDSHLQACGGLSGTAPPETANTPPAGASTGASTAAPAAASAAAPAAATAPATTAAPSSNTGSGSHSPVPTAPQQAGNFTVGSCQIPTDVSFKLIGAPKNGIGLVTQFSGASVSYHTWTLQTTSGDAKAYQTQLSAMNGNFSGVPIVTRSVQRPGFFAAHCSGFTPGTAGGPWYEASASGQPARYLWVDRGGSIVWRELTPELVQAMLH